MHAVASRVSADLGLCARDRRIIDLALAKLRGARVEFGDAIRALREAAEEAIPGGRVFFLGSADAGPIVGSIVTGVGIVERASGIELVRAQRGGVAPIGWLSR